MNISKELVNVITSSNDKGTKAYDTQATVVRVEGSTAWVHIPGGVDETPVRMTMNAKKGDAVQVRVSGGTAFLVGNASSPPTDDTLASEANDNALAATLLAEDAGRSAATARDAAAQATQDAEIAHSAATRATEAVEALTDEVEGLGTRVTSAETEITSIEGDISELQTDVCTAKSNISAIQGNITELQSDVNAAESSISTIQGNITTLQYDVGAAQTNIQSLTGRVSVAEGDITTVEGNISALTGRVADAEDDINATLEGLAIAQNVVGTLDWITSHSALTEDTSPVSGKNYYIKNQDNTFTPVTDTEGKNPAEEGWYEMDEAISNYVASHIALTDDGLYVLTDDSDWKVLISDDGVYIIDGSSGINQIVATYSGIVRLGREDESHVDMDYHSMQLIDKYGDAYFYVSDLRNKDGIAQITDEWCYDSSTSRFTLTHTAVDRWYGSTLTVVNSDGTDVSSQYEASYTDTKGFNVTPSIPAGYTVTITYFTKDPMPAFTFGYRNSDYTVGDFSFCEGQNIAASGYASHSEGWDTIAEGNYAHAEGYGGLASGEYSHIEGTLCNATGNTAHAEGSGTTASGQNAHAEGSITNASGYASHSEGRNSSASGDSSHAEGNETVASGYHSHAEGNGSQALGSASHAEGYWLMKSGLSKYCSASGKGAHAEGVGTMASGDGAHSEGYLTTSYGEGCHAEGYYNNINSGAMHAHVEGESNTITANGRGSHAEGKGTTVNNYYSHTEGQSTTANGYASHAEGYGTTANEEQSHSEGYNSYAAGKFSHAQNLHTIAHGRSQTTLGEYNAVDEIGKTDETHRGKYAVIVGNGASTFNRSNALTVDWSGNVWSSGDVENGSGDKLSEKADTTAVPTATSDLTNDSGYITSSAIPTNVSAFANDAAYLDKAGILNLFYPVGSYYETSDTAFDPNAIWGGTWILETEGQVHISAGSSYAVAGALTDSSDGGMKDAIIPYHDHVLTRTTDVGVAAHGITQPTFNTPNHTHGMGNLWSNGSGSTTAYTMQSSRKLMTRNTTSSGGGVACSRTTNVALTNNHSVTQPEFSCEPAGVSGNVTDANMQPYIIVNRWHRTA